MRNLVIKVSINIALLFVAENALSDGSTLSSYKVEKQNKMKIEQLKTCVDSVLKKGNKEQVLIENIANSCREEIEQLEVLLPGKSETIIKSIQE